jgi:hypothetical protein
MDQAIQDGIGQSRIADNLMPVIYGKLTGNQRRLQAVAIFKDF